MCGLTTHHHEEERRMDTTHSGVHIEEDFILPIQLLPSPRRILSPEHRLALAVVSEAKRDLWSSRAVIRDSALAFFLSKDRTHYFAFLNLCDYLDVRPTALRRYARFASRSMRELEAA
jgi:hypothetical protein